MDCETAQDKLSPFLDGELDAETRSEMLGHLQTCPDCSLEHEERKQMHDDLDRLGDPAFEVSDGFTRDLLAKARREFSLTHSSGGANAQNRRPRLTKTALPAVALLVGLMLGTVLGWGFVNTLRIGPLQSRPAAVLPDNGPAADRPAPVAPEITSFNDAYFELAGAESPGGSR